MLSIVCIACSMAGPDIIDELVAAQPMSLIVEFEYTDTSVRFNLERKRTGTTEDKTKGRLYYKNGKYRIDVKTNRWETSYTIIYDGVDTLRFHDNYPDGKGQTFNQVNYYDAHHDGLISVSS